MSLYLKKLQNNKFNRGMTYVELIVVLSIFSVMSSITVFNYGEFQAKVDIKGLANDFALKIVEAQKSSVSGKFPSISQQAGLPATWKPSYGIYINKVTDDKSFIYFTDLNNNQIYEGTNCTGECVEKISITKGNYISDIRAYSPDGSYATINDVSLVFKRPNPGVIGVSNGIVLANLSYVQISIASPKSAQANVKIYTFGRIQIN